MQEQAGFSLNCSANDVRVSKVARYSQGNPAIQIHDDGCAYPGDTVDFTATFEIITTATSRYDIGVYFSTDADTAQDGALTGSCAISALDASLAPDATITPPVTPAPDLDSDYCGDSTKAGSPLYTTVTLNGVVCRDSDDNGFLDLPNCVSWRQTGANEYCDAVTDLYPGAPSKCNCNEGFNIDIVVPDARLQVTKEASPARVSEPGGNVTYTVTVQNTGVDPNNGVTLTTLVDDVYGDVTFQHGAIVSTTCDSYYGTKLDPATKEGGDSTYSCQFVALASGNAGENVTDVVTADGTDDRGAGISGYDDASVKIIGRDPTITVTKTPSTDEVLEPGADVTFSVTVKNTSVTSDPVTIQSMLDEPFGAIQMAGGKIKSTTCAIGQLVPPGGSYTCSFVVYVTGTVGTPHEDTVTVLAVDDDDVSVSAKDSALVNIKNVPSSIDVAKTAKPASVPEPGGEVTYTVIVTNTSSTDTVTINSLLDDRFGQLMGHGTCTSPQVLLPGAYFSCQVTKYISGNSGDDHKNIVTASGFDDDGVPVSFSDDELVNISNVPPAASVNKVTYKVVAYYSVEVTNESSAEELLLTSLIDDKVGDLIALGFCNKADIQPKGKYTCTFDAELYEDTINEVTATLEDDEGGKAEAKDTAQVTFK